jgi:hypothetical protein
LKRRDYRIAGQLEDIRLKDEELAVKTRDFQECATNFSNQSQIILSLQMASLTHTTSTGMYLAEIKELTEKLADTLRTLEQKLAEEAKAADKKVLSADLRLTE